MSTSPRVRPATTTDVSAIAALMDRSVRILCTADHHDDPQIIARWLRDKTPAGFARRIDDSQAGGALLCAIGAADERLQGFGQITADGEILLLYVDPEAAGRGAGATLLSALEQHARTRGLTSVRLDATRTAESFYSHHGYASGCKSARSDGLRCLGMSKTL